MENIKELGKAVKKQQEEINKLNKRIRRAKWMSMYLLWKN